MKNNNIKKLVEQWEFKTKNCKTNMVIQAIKSLEIDETTEVARVKAKTENGTFVKFTYKNRVYNFKCGK